MSLDAAPRVAALARAEARGLGWRRCRFRLLRCDSSCCQIPTGGASISADTLVPGAHGPSFLNILVAGFIGSARPTLSCHRVRPTRRLARCSVLLRDPQVDGYSAARMPTVLRSGPYRLFFYSGDAGEPPHVHVERDASIAKFWLKPVRLQEWRIQRRGTPPNCVYN